MIKKMIIKNKMCELLMFDTSTIDTRNDKRMHKNSIIIAKEMEKVLDCLNIEQKIALTMTLQPLHVDGDYILKVLTLAGFDENMIYELITDISIINLYASLTAVLADTNQISIFKEKVQNRLGFLIKYLLYNCYIPACNNENAEDNVDKLYSIINQIDDIEGIDADFPFFTREQNDFILPLINLMLELRDKIVDLSPSEIYDMVRNTNFPKLIEKLDSPFPDI